jgi:hypothetical protein
MKMHVHTYDVAGKPAKRSFHLPVRGRVLFNQGALVMSEKGSIGALGKPEYGGAKLAKWETLTADEKRLFAAFVQVGLGWQDPLAAEGDATASVLSISAVLRPAFLKLRHRRHLAMPAWNRFVPHPGGHFSSHFDRHPSASAPRA